MKKIVFNNKDMIRISGGSSKGNQPKWYDNGIWYKADYMGYEALSEIVVSRLLVKSNVKNYVQYYPVKIKIDEEEKLGCYSINFKKDSFEMYSLERLHVAYNGVSLPKKLCDFKDIEHKIQYVIEFIKQVTNLDDVEKYLTIMIELDAFFLNEDRHTNNIAFLRDSKTKKFSFCPYFDFGLSLLSDLNDYSIDKDVYDNIDRVQAKPFSTDFDEQLEAMNKLFGDYVKFSFDNKDIDMILKEYEGTYSNDILNRVRTVLLNQKHKYQYMFD